MVIFDNYDVVIFINKNKNNNKIIASIAVLIMLSVSFSSFIGNIGQNEAETTFIDDFVGDDMDVSSNSFRVKGTITVEHMLGTKFEDLKVVLRNTETKKNHTTFVDDFGNYGFLNIDEGKYGLYVFGEVYPTYRTVDLRGLDASNEIAVDVPLVNIGNSITGNRMPVGSTTITAAVYPSHGIATMTARSGSLTGDYVIPDIFILDGVEYALTNVTAAINALGATSITLPFGHSELKSGIINNNTSSRTATLFVPSTVTFVHERAFYGVNPSYYLSNVIFEEGSPFFVNSRGYVCEVDENGQDREIVFIPQWVAPDMSKFVTGMSTLVAPDILRVGQAAMLSAFVLPGDVQNSSLRWVSSDPSVAAVSGGFVKALSEGEVTITVSSGEDSDISSSCTIRIEGKPEVEVLTVSFEDMDVTRRLSEGNLQLRAIIDPVDATDKSVTWFSSDIAVARVTETGMVVPRSVGEVVITATAINGASNECRITFYEEDVSGPYDVTGKVLLGINNPTNYSEISVVLRTVSGMTVGMEWLDSNDSFRFSNVASGTYYLYFFGNDTYPGFRIVEVDNDDVDIGTFGLINVMIGGSSMDLESNTNYTYIWRPNNVASLHSSSRSSNLIGDVIVPGVIYTRASSGDSTMIYRSVYKISLFLNVNVTSLTVPYGVIELDEWSLRECPNLKTLYLPVSVTSITALPESVANVYFEVGSLFTVDSEGWICDIDGNQVIRIPSYPEQPYVAVDDLAIEGAPDSLYVGDLAILNAIVTPNDATNRSVIWSSSDVSVATVSPSGVVTAKGDGTVRVTAMVDDGDNGMFSVYHDIEVKVVSPSSISFAKGSGTLKVGERDVLIPLVGPINTTYRDVEWSSSNSDVASVSDGIIVALKVGTANITATCKGDSSLSVTYTVTVDAAPSSSKVTFSSDVGSIDARVNGSEFKSGSSIRSTDTVVLMHSDVPGFEFVEWMVSANGKVEYHSSQMLRLEGVVYDTSVEAVYRYYSLSNIPTGVIDMGVPTSDDDLALRWMFGVGIQDPSAMRWTGHSSIPLVVGDYVYVRVLDRIHKVSIETGMSMATCPSVSTTLFYHSISYAHGLLFDGFTNRVYDVDLNYVMDFQLGYDGKIFPRGDYTYMTYYVNSIKYMTKYSSDMSEVLWNVNAVGSYGADYVFHEGYIYHIYVDGNIRGIASRDDATGKVCNVITFPNMDGHLLDEGWLTLYGSTLYMSSYTQGLFDSGNPKMSTIAYVDIDRGDFYDARFLELVGSQNTSAFHIFEGRAYVYGPGNGLSVYNVVGDSFELAYTAAGGFSHGGIVLDIGRYDSEGKVYVYVLPYRPTDGDLIIYFDEAGQTSGRYRSYEGLVASQYGSQSIRAGPNGELIWYNDAGFVYCVDVIREAEKEFNILLLDDDEGTWVRESGATFKEALGKAEGVEILDDGRAIMLNGERVYAFYWSMKFDRWEAVSNVSEHSNFTMNPSTYSTWVLSPARPSNNMLWYNANSDGIMASYTIASLILANVPSGSALTSVAPTEDPVMHIDESHIGMVKDGRATIQLSFGNVGVDTRVVWSSSNMTVATVDQYGNIRAVGAGTAVITATSYSNPDVSVSCDVTVVAYVTGVSPVRVDLDVDMRSMSIGDIFRIGASISPGDSNPGIIWKSSNLHVAIVDENGNVMALHSGTTVITAMSEWNPFIEVSCEVTVVVSPVADILVSGVSIDKTSASLESGKTLQLIASVEPGNATNASATWSSSNTSVATVSSNGIVTAVSAGTATITVTTVDGNRTAMCTVTVTSPSSTKVNPVDSSQGVETTVKDNGNGRSESISDVPTSNSNGVATVDSAKVAETVRQIERADGISGSNTLTPAVNIDAGNSNTVRIADAKSLANANASLRIESRDGTVEIPSNALKGMASSAGDLVIELREADRGDLSDVQRSKVSDNDLVITVTATIGSTQVHSLGGKITVSIPYALKSGETADGLRLWFLSDDGTMEEMGFRYVNGNVVFETDHLSEFVISHASASGGDGNDSTMLFIAAIAIIVVLALVALLVIRRSKTTA